MQSPAVMFIESAAEALPKRQVIDNWIFASQVKELDSFGPGRLEDLRAKVLLDPSDMPNDFRLGYLLGIETARTLLRMNVGLMKAGVKPEDLL